MYNIEDVIQDMQTDRDHAWDIIDTINTIILEIEFMNLYFLKN